jgi:hypothetical protein
MATTRKRSTFADLIQDNRNANNGQSFEFTETKNERINNPDKDQFIKVVRAVSQKRVNLHLFPF